MASLGVRLGAAALFILAGDPFAADREKMVREQIEARGLRTPAVLNVMRSVPRHLFVPEELRRSSYEDHPLPIGYGQTISQPYVVALMTDLLGCDKNHRVLEIGTGSGYQAAILSLLARRVYSIEIVPELAASSAARLKQAGYDNVTVRAGDGYLGWPEEAPFDRILLTAAPPEIPQSLLDQLRPGGRLVAPVGRFVWEQELVIVEKNAKGELRRRAAGGVRFVPMVKKPAK